MFVYRVAMIIGHSAPVRTRGVTMRPMRLIAVAGLAGLLALPALAFQENSTGGETSAEKPAAVAPLEAPKTTVEPGKGLSLKMPEVSIGKGSGTEVRIPGIGSVGVLPKLDFGLELLYGATESRGRPDDRSEPSDVQIRGTIKHRF
jgi:hypothetical protein